MRGLCVVLVLGALSGCALLSPWSPPGAPTPKPSSRTHLPHAGYLGVAGGKLIDSTGRPARLAGVSWFGTETAGCAPAGLGLRNWHDLLHQIKTAGFNLVRIPFSNRLIDDPTCAPRGIDYRKNPDLKGLGGLSLLDRIIQGAGHEKLKVILDRHAPAPGVRSPFWYTEQVPESRWISDWVMIAAHYRGNPTLIGADIDNEPHDAATWGDGNLHTDWRLAAERGGNAVLKANPDLLILIQGIQYYHGDQYWWGGQLMGAGPYPVRLSRPQNLVYTPHDYGPGVAPQQWFGARDYPRNLIAVWDKHWGYLLQKGTPLLIGEFGATSVGLDPAGLWFRTLMTYLAQRGIGYVYWSWNPDSADSIGLLQRDWTTINEMVADALRGKYPSASPSASPHGPSSPPKDPPRDPPPAPKKR